MQMAEIVRRGDLLTDQMISEVRCLCDDSLGSALRTVYISIHVRLPTRRIHT
jgi:hypothetical protein